MPARKRKSVRKSASPKRTRRSPASQKSPKTRLRKTVDSPTKGVSRVFQPVGLDRTMQIWTLPDRKYVVVARERDGPLTKDFTNKVVGSRPFVALRDARKAAKEMATRDLFELNFERGYEVYPLSTSPPNKNTRVAIYATTADQLETPVAQKTLTLLRQRNTTFGQLFPRFAKW